MTLKGGRKVSLNLPQRLCAAPAWRSLVSTFTPVTLKDIQKTNAVLHA